MSETNIIATDRAVLMALIQLLKEKILVFDGAMGTMLQKAATYSCPEELLLTNPGIVLKVHEEYAKAGADVLTTNTFGANRIKLAEYGLEAKSDYINSKAVELAKSVGKYVAASVGPTGKMIRPLGELHFDEATEAFYQQIKSQAGAGADIILIETMQDVHEAKAAAIAAREFNLPVIVSFTYEKNLRTLTGTSPEGAAIIFESLADAIGVNCSANPEIVREVVRQYSDSANMPILAQANKPVHDNIPDEVYAATALSYIDEGASIIGGCCGTTPDTIRLLAEGAAGKKCRRTERSFPTRLASRSRTLNFQGTAKIIGERINTTGKKWLKTALEEKNYSRIAEEAQKQTSAGADALDINVCHGDEAENMHNAVEEITRRLDIPMLIDSADAKAIEAGLKAYPGKAVVNSVNADTAGKILPLVKKYGAAVVVLSMDERGIPEKAEDRIEAAEKTAKLAEQHGIRKEDLLIDCLALAVGAEQKKVFETIRAISLAKQKGYTTVLGVSNVSFKMPNRELLNSSFLSMALASGLDAAIADPTNEAIIGAANAAMTLMGKDENCLRYLSKYGGQKQQEAATLEERISAAIISGEKEKIAGYVEEALASYKPMTIIDNLLIPSITTVGERFDKGTLYLPQLMLSAEAMQKGLERAKREIKKEDQTSKGKIVLATVEGDLHDIGKSIVKLVLETNGYEVLDLGKNVKAEKIISTLKESKAEYLGLSALLTTTAEKMTEVIALAKNEGLSPKIIIGGAAVNQEFADKIGAYAFCKTPFDAIEKLK